MAQFLSSIMGKRNKPARGAPSSRGGKGDGSSSSSSSSDEEDTNKEWMHVQDPYGRPCWQHRQTGQVTYGNSYAMPHQGYNPALAQQGFSEAPMYGAAGAAAAGPYAGGQMHVPGPYPSSPVGYPSSPVGYPSSPAQYMSPVPYGVSPVAMYPTAPWNAGAMPPSPVPVKVPDYVKKQHAEAEKARKKIEEARKKAEEARLKEEQRKELKRLEAEKLKAQKELEHTGVWERHYDGDGGKYWQHSVSKRKRSTDPYY